MKKFHEDSEQNPRFLMTQRGNAPISATTPDDDDDETTNHFEEDTIQMNPDYEDQHLNIKKILENKRKYEDLDNDEEELAKTPNNFSPRVNEASINLNHAKKPVVFPNIYSNIFDSKQKPKKKKKKIKLNLDKVVFRRAWITDSTNSARTARKQFVAESFPKENMIWIYDCALDYALNSSRSKLKDKFEDASHDFFKQELSFLDFNLSRARNGKFDRLNISSLPFIGKKNKTDNLTAENSSPKDETNKENSKGNENLKKSSEITSKGTESVRSSIRSSISSSFDVGSTHILTPADILDQDFLDFISKSFFFADIDVTIKKKVDAIVEVYRKEKEERISRFFKIGDKSLRARRTSFFGNNSSNRSNSTSIHNDQKSTSNSSSKYGPKSPRSLSLDPFQDTQNFNSHSPPIEFPIYTASLENAKEREQLDFPLQITSATPPAGAMNEQDAVNSEKNVNISSSPVPEEFNNYSFPVNGGGRKKKKFLILNIDDVSTDKNLQKPQFMPQPPAMELKQQSGRKRRVSIKNNISGGTVTENSSINNGSSSTTTKFYADMNRRYENSDELSEDEEEVARKKKQNFDESYEKNSQIRQFRTNFSKGVQKFREKSHSLFAPVDKVCEKFCLRPYDDLTKSSVEECMEKLEIKHALPQNPRDSKSFVRQGKRTVAQRKDKLISSFNTEKEFLEFFEKSVNLENPTLCQLVRVSTWSDILTTNQYEMKEKWKNFLKKRMEDKAKVIHEKKEISTILENALKRARFWSMTGKSMESLKTSKYPNIWEEPSENCQKKIENLTKTELALEEFTGYIADKISACDDSFALVKAKKCLIKDEIEAELEFCTNFCKRLRTGILESNGKNGILTTKYLVQVLSDLNFFLIRNKLIVQEFFDLIAKMANWKNSTKEHVIEKCKEFFVKSQKGFKSEKSLVLPKID